MKFIDLSAPLENEEAVDFPPKITFIDHKKGAELLGGAFSLASAKSPLSKLWKYILFALGIKPLKASDFPDGLGLAWEKITVAGHRGTHFDAPYHFGPLSEGKPSKTIDEVPLDFCYGNGVVLDLRHKKAGELISRQEIEAAAKKINYEIQPRDIVLIMTGADKYWGQKIYPRIHPGVSREAILYLLNLGVKVIGIDAFGFDRAFDLMINEYQKTGNSAVLWPAHLTGRIKEYFHIERLINLDKIPQPHGFKVACFPIKIKKASMGWVRAVAMVEE